MDLNDTPEQAQYRERVRAWLEEHKHEAPPASGALEGDYLAARRARNLPISFPGTTGVPQPMTGGKVAAPTCR